MGIRQSEYLYPAIGGFLQYTTASCHVISPILSSLAHIKLVNVSVTVPSSLLMKRSPAWSSLKEIKRSRGRIKDIKEVFFVILFLQYRCYRSISVASFGMGTTSTGRLLRLSTFCGTDPKKVWANIPLPCAPKITISLLRSSAVFSISSTASPS